MEKEQVEPVPLLDQSQQTSLPVRHSEDVKHFSRLERQLGPSHVECPNLGIGAMTR